MQTHILVSSFEAAPKDRSLDLQNRGEQLPGESAGGRPRPGRDGGRAKSEPQDASVAAPFGDPYMVRVSGDFLPKLCVVTSARMSVCKLRLQFVERGVVEGKLMDSRCRTFYCPR